MPASLSSDPVPAVVEKEASGSVAADGAFAKARRNRHPCKAGDG